MTSSVDAVAPSAAESTPEAPAIAGLDSEDRFLRILLGGGRLRCGFCGGALGVAIKILGIPLSSSRSSSSSTIIPPAPCPAPLPPIEVAAVAIILHVSLGPTNELRRRDDKIALGRSARLDRRLFPLLPGGELFFESPVPLPLLCELLLPAPIVDAVVVLLLLWLLVLLV
ncbi:hypothetical protein F5H01DRAFT_345838 [Linnemannia elongata]|nr:hypothetical protein F5H01DRAFT_345838 [Linnemannia elongata]